MKLKLFECLSQLLFTLTLSAFIGIIYIGSFHFFHVETVFYFGIGTIFIAALLLSVLFFVLSRKIINSLAKINLQTRDFFPCLLAAILIMYSFHLTFPTIIDRSISIYVLNQLDHQGGTASLATLQNKFLTGYVNSVSVVCRRMSEQIKSGNIVQNADRYSLTKRGERTIKFLRVFAKFTGVDPYYVESNNPNELPYQYKATPNGCEATTAHKIIKLNKNV